MEARGVRWYLDALILFVHLFYTFHMKTSILILAILFAVNTLSARDNGTKKPVASTERVSTDRFFYITYRFVDACGVGRVGSFVWSSRYAYPNQSDLLLRAADLTYGDHRCIQITGIDAICQADFNALRNLK